jgi:hypothetical protein
MSLLSIEQKTSLSELLEYGHRMFGKVLPRRPYLEKTDDDGSNEGKTALRFRGHPLLKNLPDGAASDLTFQTQNNRHSGPAIKQRQLQASLKLQHRLGLRYGHRVEAHPMMTPPKPY